MKNKQTITLTLMFFITLSNLSAQTTATDVITGLGNPRGIAIRWNRPIYSRTHWK